MSKKPSFVLCLDSYDKRYYTTVKTAVKGVFGYGNSDPSVIKLYCGEGTSVDWFAFRAWAAKWGGRLFYPPAPQCSIQVYGQALSSSEAAIWAQYKNELDAWEKSTEALKAGYVSQAEAELAKVFH